MCPKTFWNLGVFTLGLGARRNTIWAEPHVLKLFTCLPVAYSFWENGFLENVWKCVWKMCGNVSQDFLEFGRFRLGFAVKMPLKTCKMCLENVWKCELTINRDHMNVKFLHHHLKKVKRSKIWHLTHKPVLSWNYGKLTARFWFWCWKRGKNNCVGLIWASTELC